MRSRAVPGGAVVLSLVLLLCGCGAVGSSRSSPSPGGPPAAAVTVAPVDVAYRAVGSGPRTLVLVHGGPGQPSPDMMDGFLPLTRLGFRVVYYDQRGVGASPRPPLTTDAYGPQAYVADLERLRQRLGADQVDLYGVSFGGLVVALYTAAHPDRVRTVVESDGEPMDLDADTRGQDGFRTRLTTLQAEGVVPSVLPDAHDCAAAGRAVAPVLAPDVKHDKPYVAELGRSRGCSPDVGQETADGMDAQDVYIAQQALALKAWHGDALVVEGAKDPYGLGWEDADAAQFAGAHVTRLVVPGAGHIPTLDDPGLTPQLLAYLEQS